MSLTLAKRFYKTVEVVSADGGWGVGLDGRSVKTPGGAPLILARHPLAEAIAAEWRGQGERIRPETMPLYRLMATAIDRVGPRRSDVIAVTLKFAETDLLCYRAETPSDLTGIQHARWQPVLDWSRDEFGCELRVTAGVVPINQPAAALAALGRAMAALDDFALTGISAAAAATGSLVLALALARGRVEPDEAAEIALLEESYQAEQWGEDAEAQARRARIRAEIADTARFLNLLR